MNEIQRRFAKAMERRLDDRPVQFVFNKRGWGMSEAPDYYSYVLASYKFYNNGEYRASYDDAPAHPTLLVFNYVGIRR